MTSYVTEINKELDNLIKEGHRLLEILALENVDFAEFVMGYQLWYTKALNIVGALGPQRLDEFTKYHRDDKRKAITYETYTLSDYVVGLRVTYTTGEEMFNHKASVCGKFSQQVLIVQSLKESLASKLVNLRTVLEADLFDSELTSAAELRKKGHYRASGSLAGVVLEKHLKSICTRHNLKTGKSSGISALNDVLKDNEVVDVPTWRLIQRLADLRNLCTHAKNREPKSDEIEELITSVDKVIKTVN